MEILLYHPIETKSVTVPEDFEGYYERGLIQKYPSDLLRTLATHVQKFDKKLRALTVRMIEILNGTNGLAIAAPQIGTAQRVIIIQTPTKKPVIMVNPEFEDERGKQIGQEGCLSIPGLYADVERYESLTITYQDRKGRTHKLLASGTLARIIQHEIDHLNGVLFIDKAIEGTEQWIHPSK